MPVSHRYDLDLIILEAIGTYSVADLKTAVQRVIDDPDAPREGRLLFDLTRSTSLPGRSSEDVRGMAVFLRSLQARLGPRVAMLVASEVAYGLMRMGSAWADDDAFTAEVFTDLRAATDWLRAP